MKKIGIFGGTFNPVHNCHVEMSKAFKTELQLDKLFIIPTFISPHKIGKKVSSGEDRLNMLKLAFSGEEDIEPCDYELKKEGTSYTYETIEHFKTLYKDAEIYFLLGSDMLEDFKRWKNPDYIARNSKIVLTSREGQNSTDEKALLEFSEKYGYTPVILKYSGKEVSSTAARIYLKLGLDASRFLPERVERYAVEHNLYPPDKNYESVIKNLPIKRRTHTAGVILTALKYNEQLKLNAEKVEISCLLHDVAKYLTASDYPNFHIPDNVPPQVVHQFLGAYIAREELGIEDEEILNAIKYHTTGRENMTEYEKLVFTADLLEPSRNFEGVEKLRRDTERDFERGFRECVVEIYKFLKRDNGDIYPLTVKAYEYYKEE